MPSLIWIITGIILFGGMTAGGISLWIKRRKAQAVFDPFEDVKMQPNVDDFKENDNKK